MADLWQARATAVGVRERPAGRMLALRLRRPGADDLARIAALIGTVLPTTPNRVGAGQARAIWTGPDEWLILGDTPPAAAIEAAAGDAKAVSCVEIGDGRCVFDVTGPAAIDLLAKGTSLDLDPTVFAEGSSALTLFAQGNAIIDRRPDGDGFTLIMDVSIRHYLRDWFADAVVEFG